MKIRSLLVYVTLATCALFIVLYGILKMGKEGDSLSLLNHAVVHPSSTAALHALQKWVVNIGYYEHKVFSQNGEDGVIENIFSNIGTTNKYFVEFGIEDGSECNTRLLLEQHKWTGLRMDGSNESAERLIRKEFITPDNVVSLFAKYSVPLAPDFLTVDTDFFDYWLLDKILSEGYKPRLIAMEINSKLGAGQSKTVPFPHPEKQTKWEGLNDYFGASVGAFHHLLQKFNYSMVYCEQLGVNCFAVRDDILGGSLSSILTPALLHRPPRYGTGLCGHVQAAADKIYFDVSPPIVRNPSDFSKWINSQRSCNLPEW